MADKTKHTVTLTDAVQPGSDGVTLELGKRRLHFVRAMGREDVKDQLSHADVALTEREAVQLARAGYELKPDPAKARAEAAKKRHAEKVKAKKKAEAAKS